MTISKKYIYFTIATIIYFKLNEINCILKQYVCK